MATIEYGPTKPPGEGWKEVTLFVPTDTLVAVHENGRTIMVSENHRDWRYVTGCGPVAGAGG